MVTFSDALFSGQLHAHFPPFIAELKLGITELFFNIVWEVEDLIERVESGESRTLSLGDDGVPQVRHSSRLGRK